MLLYTFPWRKESTLQVKWSMVRFISTASYIVHTSSSILGSQDLNQSNGVKVEAKIVIITQDRYKPTNNNSF